MAYYAFLDNQNIVTEVIRGLDEDEGIDWEQRYGEMRNQVCKRTSYNTHGGIYYDPVTGEPAADQSKSYRKNYAAIGYTYDNVIDGFIPPKPFPSWLLNTTTCFWEPPIPYPSDGGLYAWDEATQSWVAVNDLTP
jgi:hypothetical protein